MLNFITKKVDISTELLYTSLAVFSQGASMIGRFEKFTFAISELSRYWHKIAADEMAAYGLKGPYAVYLVAMYRHPEGITAAKLCALCDKNKADVSRAMSALEEKGLVCRKSGTTLYRSMLVLTEQGKEAARHVKELAERAVEVGGKGLTDEQRENFYTSLETIAANLKKVSENGLQNNPLPD
jgi:DNA-binding MarR family transcriptional regulator